MLAQPAVEALLTDRDGIYVDATFGRGGHSTLILERLAPNGRLIALDRDLLAVEAAQLIADPRFHVEHTPFSRLRVTLDALSITGVQGVLFDLGISSPQIDDPPRGFSLRADGPLDMRMDTSRGETAAECRKRARRPSSDGRESTSSRIDGTWNFRTPASSTSFAMVAKA